MKLQAKVSLYMGGMLVGIGLVVALVVGSATGRIIKSSVEVQMKERLDQLLVMIDAYRSQSESLADFQMGALSRHLRGEWRRSEGETVQTAGLDLPALRLNGHTLNNDYSQPDQFTRDYGSAATVFVRHKDDFYRITTSLKKADGSRAVGTPLGNGHPAYAGLLQGQPYVGKATLFGRDYITKYLPIKGDNGEVIAVLFVGVDFSDNLKALKSAIRDFKIGATGYVFALDVGTGKSNGEFVIHPTSEGKSTFEYKDATTGANFFKDVVGRSEGIIHYHWDDPKRGVMAKYSVFKNYDPWKIQFHIGVFEDDVMAAARESAIWVAAAMVLGSLLMAGMAILPVRKLVLGPLGGEPSTALSISAGVAAGDLTQATTAAEGTVLGSLGKMQRSLAQVITEVMANARTISERTETLSAATRDIEQNAAEQADATASSAASIEELTASIGTVSQIANATEEKSRKVSELAEQGVKLIQTAGSQISSVRSSVESTSSQMLVLQTKTNEIGSIAHVIREIAEQTNLLALNAAIEAARAGDQGRGFAVVADEVRKLAERTSVATEDIAKMIATIQDENAHAVQEMEKVTPLVGQSIAAAEEATTALQDIHREAAESLEQVKAVSLATQEQAVSATAIAQNMERIAGMSDQNKLTIHEVAGSTTELDRVAAELRKQVSGFKV